MFGAPGGTITHRSSPWAVTAQRKSRGLRQSRPRLRTNGMPHNESHGGRGDRARDSRTDGTPHIRDVLGNLFLRRRFPWAITSESSADKCAGPGSPCQRLGMACARCGHEAPHPLGYRWQGEDK
jgi:hypothetical protein